MPPTRIFVAPADSASHIIVCNLGFLTTTDDDDYPVRLSLGDLTTTLTAVGMFSNSESVRKTQVTNRISASRKGKANLKRQRCADGEYRVQPSQRTAIGANRSHALDLTAPYLRLKHTTYGTCVTREVTGVCRGLVYRV